MASAAAAADHRPSQFACRCLNVRLSPVPTQSAPPESPRDTAFTKIHVGDEGVHVEHPQLTVRVKSRATTIPDTSRYSRFTTLTCLACDLLVYRTHQVISTEVEAKDLPLLPSDDWAEQEVMKSSSGWVEVHEDCLSGDAIAQAESSDNYSRLYSLVLSSHPELTTPLSPKTRISPESTASSTPTPATPASYLSNLPPLFPPPPFTPSHPAFLHLLSLAEKESQSLRATAEGEIATIVREKTAQVQAHEAELKLHVEQLWFKFKQGLDKIQQDKPHANTHANSSRSSDHRNGNQSYGTPVAIRDFVPVSVTLPVRSATSPVPKRSALSASLVHNNIHQAMADRGGRNNDNASIGSGRTSSTQSASPTLVPGSANEHETSTVLRFKRNVDDSLNTAASYRYFVNLEEDIARHKEQNGRGSDNDETMGVAGPSKPQAGDGNKQHLEPRLATDDPKMKTEKAESKENSSNDKDSKGKRKHVHFNVQPPVKAAQESPNVPEKSSSLDSREMIFPLDDDLGDDEVRPSNIQHTLPLLEQPTVLPRARRTRSRHTAGLPASFSSLRPASLPRPSHIRPVRGPPGVDSSSNSIMLSLPQTSMPLRKTSYGENKDDTTDLDTGEDTTDSSPRQTPSSGSDSEDYQGQEYHHHSRYGIPASLPINIVTLSRPREVLSLASYQPKTSHANRSGATAPSSKPKKLSSAAIRRATYAERDRTRSLDPGNLDFVVEEDEEGGSEEDRIMSQSVESGVRGRNNALRILQARAEMPEEGMWRSLAS